jgi:hypothetical protein
MANRLAVVDGLAASELLYETDTAFPITAVLVKAG